MANTEALFEVTPAQLRATTAVGAEETHTATLVANRTMVLTGTSHGENTDSETTTSFSGVCPAGWFGSVTMQAGDTCQLTWTTHPTRILSTSQSASFTAQAVDAEGQPAGEPVLSSFNLELTSTVLEFERDYGFGEVPLGRDGSQTLRLTNRASTDALVSLSNVDAPFAVDERLLMEELRVPALATIEVPLYFRPTAAGPASGYGDWSYRLDDGTGDRRSGYLRLSGLGSAEQPPIDVSATGVDFGKVRVGDTVERTITLTNSSTDAVAIDALNPVDLGLLGLSLGELPEYGFVPAGESITVTISWKPTKAGALSQQALFAASRLLPARAASTPDPDLAEFAAALAGTAIADGPTTDGGGTTEPPTKPKPTQPKPTQPKPEPPTGAGSLPGTGGPELAWGLGIALALAAAGGVTLLRSPRRR
ncbi:choice-of-anchor D domain-containing protein [Leucobacter komagatae]|uniref:choice-of-anchor D domain-containing protein n=1 Tax=Leucobacter komagatae TaxID=55969 RepID=UPI0031DA08B6